MCLNNTFSTGQVCKTLRECHLDLNLAVKTLRAKVKSFLLLQLEHKIGFRETEHMAVQSFNESLALGHPIAFIGYSSQLCARQNSISVSGFGVMF